MPGSNEVPESQFAYAIVAGKRARQLMAGAPPLIAYPRSHKPTSIAMEELNASLLEYQTPEPSQDAAEKDRKGREGNLVGRIPKKQTAGE
jgi:DNA-directed RNA polymerase omega subunit